MSPKTDVRLSPGRRLNRGLKYTALGPVDVTVGALGLGVNGARSSASWVGERYRTGRLKAELAKELAAAQETIAQELAVAQEVVAGLPAAVTRARSRRRRRPLVLAAVGVVALAGGAVAFSIVRRSSQPDPSPLPPSVEVAPRP
ncbi:cell wall synthesis protein CwsA [Mycolicibacterium flavescens]|uniref:Cell wall synthesis protein CwsA n=1 Tax=Mycolicibacterium flavescens TaxID=1776 RepID=A0A1E3RFD6_MYCFV|nr:cell wall synthesis protein CwsA [Mycolicibacterium flavescens]MCV7278863.1 cell wall synthesis protein CwsA [Mycolicibacterium flavescens]ODQ88596.1 cell wall synthesis protein CwsA [Mycolicibacterium flavescens]